MFHTVEARFFAGIGLEVSFRNWLVPTARLVLDVWIDRTERVVTDGVEAAAY